MFKVVLQFLRRNSQTEIIKKKELELEFVQLLCGKASNFGIPRVRVKHVREELASHRNSSDDQPMDVVRINDQRRGGRTRCFRFFHFSHRFVIVVIVPFCLGGHSLFFLDSLTKFAHPIEIDEQAEENLICGRAVLKDAEKVGFD